MKLSYQCRLSLDPDQQRWLGEFAAHYGRVQRLHYAQVAKGERSIEMKTDFCKKYGLSARQFNAMRIDLDGKMSSTVELLKAHKKSLQQKLRSTKVAINNLVKDIAVQDKLAARAKATITAHVTAKVAIKPSAAGRTKASPTVFSLVKLKRLKHRLHSKKIRLANLQIKVEDVARRLKANVPGICFGSRKLFNQQFHLNLTKFGVGDAGHAAWKRAWQDSRDHQIFLVGSTVEGGSNQSCAARVGRIEGKTPTLILPVKMPPKLVAQGAPAFFEINGVNFNHGHPNVPASLIDNVALSYRFHRDERGWRVFVSTNVADQEITSMAAVHGMLGVDFNADHLAVARTDHIGNPFSFWRFDLPLRGKTTGQRKAILSDALDRVFVLAKEYGLGIAVEDLDFATKKRELAQLGVRRARMLSGLAYAAYKQLAEAKDARLGVRLNFVSPAYTSVAGSVKYAVRLGRTVHQAAAFVIARRAQSYSEKLPQGGACYRAPLMGAVAVLSLPVRNRGESTRSIWDAIRRSLTRHCAERVRFKKEASRGRGLAKANRLDNTHPLDGAQALFREPGEPTARRPNQNQSEVPS